MKPELIFFSENKLGGVQSFYYNLIKYTSLTDFDVKWYLSEEVNDPSAKLPKPFGMGEQVVRYNGKHGRWRVASRLQMYISNKPGIVVTNHPQELDALLFYSKTNKVIFHIVHDVVYLDFAKNYEAIIDVFVAHNYAMYLQLLELLPNRKNAIYYLPYGIKLSPHQRVSKNEKQPLKIVYLARLHKDKGIHDLVRIDDWLQSNYCHVQWLVIGDGPEKESFLSSIQNRPHFSHAILPDTDTIYKTIADADVFILPSRLDGTPVALLETMSAGLVPVVYKFNEGVYKLISKNCGFIIEKSDFTDAARCILQLQNDRDLLNHFSANAAAYAARHFDVYKNNASYLELFKNYQKWARPNKIFTKPRLRLTENPTIPYELVALYRAFKKSINL